VSLGTGVSVSVGAVVSVGGVVGLGLGVGVAVAVLEGKGVSDKVAVGGTKPVAVVVGVEADVAWLDDVRVGSNTVGEGFGEVVVVAVGVASSGARWMAITAAQ
jgi:hypothetical protein